MKIALKERAIASLAAATPLVQRAFIKQINFLVRNLQHPYFTREEVRRVQGSVAGAPQ